MATFRILVAAVCLAAASHASDPLVELPIYSVSGESPWLIAELDGFVVFSLADEKTTARFATLLSESDVLARCFAPAALGVPDSAVPDLVALEHSDVARFTPPRDRWGRRAAALPATVGDQHVSLVTEFGQDWWLGRTRNAVDLAYSRRMRLAHPALPAWVNEGRFQLCVYQPVIGDRLALESPRAALKELLPLSQALGTPEYGDSKDKMGARLIWTGQAFAHWAWTADDGRMRERWERLAVAAAHEPFTARMFRTHMGLSPEEADRALRHHVRTKPWKKGVADVRAVDTPCVVNVRRASGRETRLYVGATYLGLARRSPSTASAYVRKAIATLGAAPDADRTNAEIQAMLGLALLESGELVEARGAFARAVEAGVKRPMAYVHLANLVLGDDSRAESVVDLAPAIQALNLVRQSWTLQPEMIESHRVAARACRRLGSSHPDVANACLPDLERGVHLFPQQASLAAEVVSILRSRGELQRAADLLAFALRWSPDAPELLAQR